MARIRSVHPSLWTDEDFVSMSLVARLFLIGIWNEADDYGLFEWKPLRLKMRLAPADAIDAGVVMEEIRAAGFVVRIERDSRPYGVVKNFRQFQRPKNPSAPIIPLDSTIRDIVGLAVEDGSTPALPQPFPPPTEKPPQMEDGGGVREKEDESKTSTPPSSTPRVGGVGSAELEWVLRKAAGVEHNLEARGLRNTEPIRALLAEGFDLDRHILPVIRAESGGGREPQSWNYFVKAIRRAKATAPPPATETPPVEPRVFIAKGSPQWEAWCAHRGKPDLFAVWSTEHRCEGREEASEWPPGHPAARERAA